MQTRVEWSSSLARARMSEMTAKQQMVAILDDQPDDSTYEELLRELVFARMIDRGLADSDAGRTVSHEEMEARISSWAK